MRFAVRSAPPFCYPTKRTGYYKGGIWSGSQPQKRQTRFIRACRLSYQLYIPSNRIVKPNNRYTRQPASHDFLFYSAPDKVYDLTATNRIAMRFAVRSAPPFRYPTDSTDNSKGGIWSGSQPQAEFEAAHCRKKRQTRFIRACRLSYQLYILSNRIVKPNNRYTRLPASHDFLFYSVSDKSYVLTATNRIAMRFAVRSAPPFRYPADSSNSSKGGTVSGDSPPLRSCFPASSRVL